MNGNMSTLSSEATEWLQTGFLKGHRLEMSLGCKDIPKMDLLSKSDPFCVVYRRAENDEWEPIGSTETIDDCSSCKWVRKYFLDAGLVSAPLRFEVYDRDSTRDVLKDHDFIGYVEGKQVQDIIEERTQYAEIPLARKGSKSSYGALSIALDWIQRPATNFDVMFEIEAAQSSKTRMYFQIMKKVESQNHYVPVFRSNILGKDCAQFEPCCLKLSQLSSGNALRMIRIELLSFHGLKGSKLLGFVRTCVKDLASLGACGTLPWSPCENGLERAKVFLTSNNAQGDSERVFKLLILE